MEEPTSPAAVRRHPAAGAGAIGAALALVGAALAWPGDPLIPVGEFGSPAAALLAVVALLAFLGRRWGRLARPVGAPLATVAGVALAAVASIRLVASATGVADAPGVGTGLWLTLLAGIACIGLAVADYRGAAADDLVAMATGVAVAFALTILGFVVQILLNAPLGALIVDEFTEVAVRILSPITLVGFVVVAVGFLQATERGLEWLDVSVPSRRDLGYVVVGVVGLVGVQMLVAVAITRLDVPSSQNAVQGVAEMAADGGYAWLILLLIPIQLLIVGPVEELLFRGVIQKYLYGAFSRPGAVLVASLVFASAHVFAYWDENPAALFVSLAAVFLLALVLGTIYERTENLVVPAVVHGVFNSLLVLLMYLAAVVDLEPATLLVP